MMATSQLDPRGRRLRTALLQDRAGELDLVHQWLDTSAGPLSATGTLLCATSPRRMQTAEGRTPGRLSSYELGVSARLVELLMPSRRRHGPDPARSRRYTAGWIGLPGRGRREVLGRSVRAMGATGVGYRGRAPGSGRDTGRRLGGGPAGRRLGAVTDPIAAAMTAAGVPCTSTSGAAATASTATALG